MVVRSTDTCVYASSFGIFKRIGSHTYVIFHSAGQRAYRRPGHSLGYLYHRIEITRRRHRKSGFNDVYSKFFKRFCNLNLFYCVELASRHLLTIAKSCIKYK